MKRLIFTLLIAIPAVTFASEPVKDTVTQNINTNLNFKFVNGTQRPILREKSGKLYFIRNGANGKARKYYLNANASEVISSTEFKNIFK